MTNQNDSSEMISAAQHLADKGLDGLPEAFRIILNLAMKIERSKVLQAEPNERTPLRQGFANGFKPKTVSTRVGDICLAVPQVRDGVAFYPSALEKGLRSERALKVAIAEMYIQGVSTRNVTHVLEKLCGLDITSTQVSRAAAMLDEELEKWRTRPLGSFPYLMLDARYEKVRIDGTVRSCAVLVAVGVDTEGKRSVLGVSCKMSEAEIHWRSFLASLQARGLHGVTFIASDDHAGLRAAITTRFNAVWWQRCQFHLQQNAGAYVPKVHMRAEVTVDIRSIFNQPDLVEATRRLAVVVTKYKDSASQLSLWLENNALESLTVFKLPEPHRKLMRTTNGMENINKQLKRRTRVAGLFPNEKSLERLATALLSEISDEFETQKTYLIMKKWLAQPNSL